MKKKDYYSADT